MEGGKADFVQTFQRELFGLHDGYNLLDRREDRIE